MDCPDVCLEAFWLQEWEWVLEDCHKRSRWKNSIGVSVPRPCGSDVYVCSKSFWLCLTVVYWLLGYNKVPSWIENSEYVTILSCHLRICAEVPKLWGVPPEGAFGPRGGGGIELFVGGTCLFWTKVGARWNIYFGRHFAWLNIYCYWLRTISSMFCRRLKLEKYVMH
jgi:hypothetical protein